MSTVIESTVATSTYVMPLNTARSIASMAAFTSREKFTPALNLIKVAFTGTGYCHAWATDRYTAIKGIYDYGIEGEGIVYLDASAVKFITGIKPAKGYNPMITIETLEDNLIIKTGDASITIKQFNGNWPNIDELFDKFKPAELASQVAFKIENLARLGKIVDATNNKIDAWNLELGDPGQGFNGAVRPAPVLATNKYFKALIQPMLGLQ